MGGVGLQETRGSAAVVLFLLTMTCGVLPVAIIRYWYKRRGGSSASVSRVIANSRNFQRIMFFGGGVLIATAFCHLIPEAREQYDEYVERNNLTGTSIFGGVHLAEGDGEHDHEAVLTHENVTSIPHTHNHSLLGASDEKDDHEHGGHEHSDAIPLVEIAICIGFFAIYLIEQLMHTLFGHSHDHEDGDSSSQASLVGRIEPHHHGVPVVVTSGPKYSNASLHASGVELSASHPSCREHTPPFLLSCYRNHESSQDLVQADRSSIDGQSTPPPTYPPPGSQRATCSYEGCDNYAIEIEHEKRFLRSSAANKDKNHHTSLPHGGNYGTVAAEIDSSASSTSSRANSNVPHKETVLARFLRGIVIIVAFSMHSVFDGIAIGLQESPKQVYVLLGAIFCHKSIIAVILGFDLYQTTISLWLTAVHMALFSIMSPIGIFIVMIAEDKAPEEGSTPVLLTLQALAIGTVLYIAFFEILQEDHSKVSKKNRISGLQKWAAMVLGFLAMLLILLYVPHE